MSESKGMSPIKVGGIIIDDYEPLKHIGGGSGDIESNPTSNEVTTP